MTPDRYQRVRQLAEYITLHPGQLRKQIAQAWHLSERQVQEDLSVIRDELRLPLVRRHGYRIKERRWRMRCPVCDTSTVVHFPAMYAVRPSFCCLCGAATTPVRVAA